MSAPEPGHATAQTLEVMTNIVGAEAETVVESVAFAAAAEVEDVLDRMAATLGAR